MIRTLPTELKLLLARLATGPRSPAAFAAALRTPEEDVGWLTGYDLLREDPRAVISDRPTVMELAEKIGRSSAPNRMRAALNTGGYDSPRLHPDIRSLKHFANDEDANEFENEQALQLIATDLGQLDHLGKGSEETDLGAIMKLQSQFERLRTASNPNGRPDEAPSTSVVFDVLLQGVANRLQYMKGHAQVMGAQLVASATVAPFRKGFHPGPALLDGASARARVKALSDALHATGKAALNGLSQK
ncbi:MAG TPA: hypothetical protein VIG66_01480, partial [Noviherbaspirillum sp.]